MAETIYRGPAISLGSLMGNVITQAGAQVGAVEPTDGPGIEYQANCFPDVRFGPFNKDALTIGRLPAFLNSPYSVLVDAIPSASTATPQDICANQATTNGTAMTLVTTQPSANASGQCAHMPLAPLFAFGSSVPATSTSGATTSNGVFALDMGFAFGTTTAGSGTVTVTDSTIFSLGQWIVIGGAGNSATTLPLICQVTNPSLTATTISVSPAPSGSVTRGPISSGNAYIGYPANVTATGVQPYSGAGIARIFNPLEGVARNIGINAAAGAAGGIFTVSGWDIYGIPMSEAITVGAGAAVKYGNKCFKYIQKIVPNVTDGAAHYGVGVGDTIGFNIRADKWEYANIFINQAFLTAATGWTQALQPPSGPSTTTTADTRGSIQVGTRGNNTGVGGAGAAGGPLAGTIRVAIQMTVPLFNLIGATPSNAVPMFGVAQV